jgi:hypothetical protein
MPKKSKSKNFQKTKRQGIKNKSSRPLWQKLTLYAVCLVLIGVVSTFAYYKYTERDLRAKAAAFVYPSSSTYGDKRYKFAICYQKTNRPGIKKIVGMVTRPKGTYIFDGTRIIRTAAGNGARTEVTSYNWFRGSVDLSYVGIEAVDSSTISLLSYAEAYDKYSGTRTKISGSTHNVLVAYVPEC